MFVHNGYSIFTAYTYKRHISLPSVLPCINLMNSGKSNLNIEPIADSNKK